MTVIAHWWCPFCGAFDGPISADEECDACAEQHDVPEIVEKLVPATTAQGAVSAFQEVRDLLYTRSGTPRRGTLPAVERIDAAIDALIGGQ